MATPILDEAIRAGCGMGEECLWPSDGCNENGCALGTAALVLDALRAALPWDLPAEQLEAMRDAIMSCDEESAWDSIASADCRKAALAAYRAQPIMRELYPEQFR